ncbi:MAG: hypothetical protein ABSF50_02035 [Burkholderiaceae bacterium]
MKRLTLAMALFLGASLALGQTPSKSKPSSNKDTQPAQTVQQQTVTGTVSSLSVFGNGPNSSDMVLVLKADDGTSIAFSVEAYPVTDPSVFSAFGSLLAAAYITKSRIGITYLPMAGRVSRVVGVALHPQ